MTGPEATGPKATRQEATPTSFGARLDAALTSRGSLCVGIDPHVGLLKAWGLDDDVASLAIFAERCVQAFAETAAVIKPQSAFFERFGSAGIAVLERAVAECRAAGALVVLDVKRGDIGSTMAAYADAYLDPKSPLAVDAMTVSPFLGVGSLEPAFELAETYGAGLFVLALTSNPEGPQVQHAVTLSGASVAQSIVDDLAARNVDATPLGSYGVVVGATIGESAAVLSHLNGPFLVPGIGAQGGGPDDVRRIFGDSLGHVLPSVSREVLKAGPDVAALKSALQAQIEAYGFLRN